MSQNSSRLSLRALTLYFHSSRRRRRGKRRGGEDGISEKVNLSRSRFSLLIISNRLNISAYQDLPIVGKVTKSVSVKSKYLDAQVQYF